MNDRPASAHCRRDPDDDHHAELERQKDLTRRATRLAQHYKRLAQMAGHLPGEFDTIH